MAVLGIVVLCRSTGHIEDFILRIINKGKKVLKEQ